jgi:dTDP-4-dehydrorhamnose reductase
MRVVVTGAGGRLGQALVAAFAGAPYTGPSGPIAWDRAAFDLDSPAGVGDRLGADRAELVVHAAAWTDVDGCELDPALAVRRNGDATGLLARECAARGVDLLVVSTNEVFDGTRTDGRGYAAGDATAPANAYGASKLAGEQAAVAAYEARGSSGVLGIARTAWLFGPGRPDFPTKIAVAARAVADAAASGSAAAGSVAAAEPLRVTGDEFGTPTYTHDLAEAIADLIGSGSVAGVHHLVNGGLVSRAGWARDVLARLGLSIVVEEVPLDSFVRPSRPPRWGILAPTPLPTGETIRPWTEAMADYAPTLRRAVATAVAAR